MVNITYWPGLQLVTLQGHAGAAEAGKDPVCAAASILMYTLRALAENARESGMARRVEIRLERQGITSIRLTPAAGWGRVLRAQMDAICAGFALLGSACPEYVRFERR